MKNVTVVVATTFALISTAMAVEIARRHNSAPEVLRAPEAQMSNADASAVFAKPETTATPVQAAAQAPEPEQAPMRDASPLIPASAADATPVEMKAANAQPAPTVASQSKPGDDAKGSTGAMEAAIVKPVIARPAHHKSETERAAADKPAPQTTPHATQPSEKPHRFAKAHSSMREAEQAPPERYGAPRIRYARWQGGDASRLQPGPGAYGFSGSFGGCVYRGVVNISGYRIERSC